MANIHDNDVLMTQAGGDLFIDLECGYGQPCVTTITLMPINGSHVELNRFSGNAYVLNLGSIDRLKNNTLEIYTTIQDVYDNQIEIEDILLHIRLSENPENFVETKFTKKTKGRGELFHSFYTIVVL